MQVTANSAHRTDPTQQPLVARVPARECFAGSPETQSLQNCGEAISVATTEIMARKVPTNYLINELCSGPIPIRMSRFAQARNDATSVAITVIVAA